MLDRIDNSPDQLLACISNNDLTRLRGMLDRGVDVNSNHGAALRKASASGFDLAVSMLLGNGANVYQNPKAPDRKVDYLSPLEAAAENGHLSVVDALLGSQQHSAEDLTDALVRACAAGKLDVAIRLHRAGADRINEGSPIAWAAAGGHQKVVSWLLADQAQTPEMVEFALASAARNNQQDVLSILLLHGIEASADNSLALRLAAQNNSLECAALLMTWGADPHHAAGGAPTGPSGQSAVDTAARTNNVQLAEMIKAHLMYERILMAQRIPETLTMTRRHAAERSARMVVS